MPSYFVWSPAKRKAPRIKGDINGMSANGISMFKSVKGIDGQVEKYGHILGVRPVLGARILDVHWVNATLSLARTLGEHGYRLQVLLSEGTSSGGRCCWRGGEGMYSVGCRVLGVRVVHAPCRSTIVS
ncbi:hypothetical protein TIFTF001_010516 [Ficus carica]|uniref:Uncharacterized protein n=1 Tax=Ficus carica TaxID=3494 RepID=A0AA88AJH9_FICCA|nr:hypothetical protein TIFTF001_010516 [Ficus carica]